MPDDPAPERGLDGLTAAELRASRRGFWDEAFTATLLRLVPPGTGRIVDVGCGLATAAHALLPAIPGVAYVGVDADEGRLASAREAIASEPWAPRAELRVGRAERLPCADGEADLALVAMTLQHVPDPLAVLREIARVLRPGGRLVAVEQDNLSNLFYFDGPLDEVTAAFRAVAAELRRARHPADPAIGPAVASLAERAGFTIRAQFPHVVGAPVATPPVRSSIARGGSSRRWRRASPRTSPPSRRAARRSTAPRRPSARTASDTAASSCRCSSARRIGHLDRADVAKG